MGNKDNHFHSKQLQISLFSSQLAHIHVLFDIFNIITLVIIPDIKIIEETKINFLFSFSFLIIDSLFILIILIFRLAQETY